LATIDCNTGREESPLGVFIGSQLGNALGHDMCDLSCYGELSVWCKAHCVTGRESGDELSAWINYATTPTVAAVTQTIATRRPTWHADEVNGLATIRFNGVDQYFRISAGAAPGSEYTIMVVMKIGSASGSRSVLEIYTPDATPSGFNFYPINGQVKHYHSDNAGGQDQVIKTGALTGEWQLITIQSFSSSSHKLYIDGELKANSIINRECVFSILGDLGAIGGHNNGSAFADFYEGDIAEVAVFTDALAADVRSAAEDCLMGKYGIPKP